MTPRSRTPRKLPEPTEHESQRAFFARVAMDARTKDLPIFAIPNFSGRLGNVPPVAAMRQAQRLNAEGRKAGVPDIFVAVPITVRRQELTEDGYRSAYDSYHGLFIEMKRRGNKPTPEQMRWISDLNTRGYQVHVCYGAESAWLSLMAYLGYFS